MWLMAKDTLNAFFKFVLINCSNVLNLILKWLQLKIANQFQKPFKPMLFTLKWYKSWPIWTKKNNINQNAYKYITFQYLILIIIEN